MEDGYFTPNTPFGTLRDDTIGFDVMDELLYDGCWLETTDGSNFWQPGPFTSSNLDFPACFFPTSRPNIGHLNLNSNLHQKSSDNEIERSNFSPNAPLVRPQMEELVPEALSAQSENFQVESTERSRRFWISPSGNPSPSSSMKKKLIRAVEDLRESTKDRDVLIQIWVPIKRGGRYVLSTNNQPFSIDPNSKSLADYRDVSRRYQFAADEDSKDLVGLPGRVFLKKLPEWTPDVRFFRREEYPRIDYAKKCNVRGSLALPVFERGSGTCLGVVEVVTTTLKLNYHPELENVCKALEAVDLRSSEIVSPPNVKAYNESYQAVLREIQEVFVAVCDTHGLPLAQTWSPCTQHGKGGCRHSDENYAHCVSTIDSACYVADPKVLGFHEACSEHHLLRGEGVAGGALMTNQPCFSTDITALSKTEYPLSHHARMFGLCATVAIRLRSLYTGSSDFVLEFFLPSHCRDTEEQKQMLNSLSSVIQQVCRSLRVVTDQELEEETIMVAHSRGELEREESRELPSSLSKEPLQEKESSWIAHMTEAQHKGKGAALSLEDLKEEQKSEFMLTTNWHNYDMDLNCEQAFSEYKPFQQGFGAQCNEGSGDFSSVSSHRATGARKAGEKRRTKTDKTISLQVLQQYFAGSLKDAAKSIGVCPTTLKRICRQHGITRWPSRKIKKVSHSLRKLQLVIDSVQGSEGSIQLASFYNNFPELRSPSASGTSHFSTISKITDPLEQQLQTQPEGSFLSSGTTSSKSGSSSCSHSSGSCSYCPCGAKQSFLTTNESGGVDALLAEEPTGLLKRVHSDAELHDSLPEETKLLANFMGDHPLEASPTGQNHSSQILRDGSALRVKATFGEEKIRFSKQNDWDFVDLQREVAKRFKIEDISRIDLKYLDDDSEWVLLTCDADLEECIDILRSSRRKTIKLSLHLSFHPELGNSFGSSAPF